MPEQVKKALETLNPQSKPVIVGMGNSINADDGIGPYIIEKLNGFVKFPLLDVGTLPENFTSKIAGMNPSHVIIIDAAMIEGEPGTISTVDAGAVDDVIFTTHHIPLSYTVRRIQAMCGAEFIIIGIKPDTLEMGKEMTAEVKETGNELVQLFLKLDAELTNPHHP